jgi:hypothetical protein
MKSGLELGGKRMPRRWLFGSIALFTLFTRLASASSSRETESFRIDSPVKGAAIETIWIIDDAPASAALVQSLKQSYSYFLKDLRAAGVHQTALVLSANAAYWRGTVLHPCEESPAVDSNDPQAEKKFVDRVNLSLRAAKLQDWPRSSIWSVLYLLGSLSNLEGMGTEFWKAGVPVEVIFVGESPDGYTSFQRLYPDWVSATLPTYQAAFLNVAHESQKGWRISAMAPAGELGRSLRPRPLVGKTAYGYLTEASFGRQYPTDDPHFDMDEALHDHASQLIFRAYVHAKARLKLNQHPKSTASVHVSIGNYTLPADSGSNKDAWRYDPTTNSVLLHWYLLENQQWKPGDSVRVEY